MDFRQIKGFELAKQRRIRREKDGWLVPSLSGASFYKVNEEMICNCPDSVERKVTCKHAYAVRYKLKEELNNPQPIVKAKRQTYPQNWSAYNEAQTTELSQFDALLKDLVQELEEPAYSFGRPPLSLREQAFCTIRKVYSQLSSRRAVGLYSRAVDKGQLKHKPHFNVTSKFLNRADVTPMLERLLLVSASPLKAVETCFAVDSTGFRTRCFSQYAANKYGIGADHQWLKAHVIAGTKTNIITSAIITQEYGADGAQFSALVQATADGGFKVEQVVADKAYSYRQNHEIVDKLGGQAYIPFRTNATGRADGAIAWRKAFFYFHEHAQDFYEVYHKRSNVEATFAAIKKKFGDTLKSKNPISQKNELLCKLVAFNVTCLIAEIHELGIKPEFAEPTHRSFKNPAEVE